MKTFTFHDGRLSPGLRLSDDPKFGKVVFLGEGGRGRKFAKISLDRFNPPPVENNVVLNCDVRKINLEDKKLSFAVLQKESSESSDFVIRVNTNAVYTRGTDGWVKALQGELTVLAQGNGARGDAGRLGTWDDLLLRVRPNDVVKVIPEGGYKTSNYVLMHNGKELEVMSETDYAQFMALNM